MELPLRIDGAETGTARVTQDGLYTVFEAELPGRAAELVRLWAHGEGRGAYLGVMQPRDGGLWFSRKLTRRELAALPRTIKYVSNCEKFTENYLHKNTDKGKDGEKTEETDDKDLHNKETEPTAAGLGTEPGPAENKAEPDDSGDTAEAEQDTAGNETGAASAQTNFHACPWPAEPQAEGLLWYRRPDGSLVSFDGISTLLALPAELHTPVPRGTERVIEGKKYLVFRT